MVLAPRFRFLVSFSFIAFCISMKSNPLCVANRLSSWGRKGLEVYFTVLIEFFWSKERIMEVYHNSIEMGKGIYGAQAAAKYKFKTTAAKLSAGQCALIAATLPNPIRFDSAHPSPS